MFGLILTFLPILQFISAGITIWGFCNTPALTDTVVEYGAFGADQSPDISMWINSVGSIIVGLGGFIGSWFAQGKTGAKSELATAVWELIKSPNNTIAVVRVGLAFISILEDKYVNNADDQKAIDFFKNWLATKLSVLKQPNALANPPNTELKPTATVDQMNTQQLQALVKSLTPQQYATSLNDVGQIH